MFPPASLPLPFPSPGDGTVELVLETGCVSIDCEGANEPRIDAVDAALAGADTVFLVVGLHALQHVENICDGRPPFLPPSAEDTYVGYCEGEGIGADRLPGLGIKNGLAFPPNQQQLVDHVVASVAGTGTTLVVVLINGSPILIDDLMKSPNVGAILEAWYPNEQGGTAIANVLFGDYNPAGRLPLTWPVDESQLPPYSDMSMAGRRLYTLTPHPDPSHTHPTDPDPGPGPNPDPGPHPDPHTLILTLTP